MPGPDSSCEIPAGVPQEDSPAARHYGWTFDLPRVRSEDRAGAALRSLRAAATYNEVLAVARDVLGPASFELGVLVGIAEGLKDMLAALLSLAKMLVLSGLYDAAHSPAYGATTAIRWEAQAIEWFAGPAMKDAHDRREALVKELVYAAKNLRAFLKQACSQFRKEYEQKWDRFLALSGHSELSDQFMAGELAGSVLVDLLMLILTVIDGAGALKALADIPELVGLAREIKAARGAAAAAKAAEDAEEAEAVAVAARAAGAEARPVVREAAPGRPEEPMAPEKSPPEPEEDAPDETLKYGLQKVKLSDVKYSQGDVSARMIDGRTISEVSEDMSRNGWDQTKPPPDMVRWDDGGLTTVDNRRIIAANEARLTDIPANVHAPDEEMDPETADRFRLQKGADFIDPDTNVSYRAGDTPDTWGEAAKFRAANQLPRGFPDFPLQGSYTTPVVR